MPTRIPTSMLNLVPLCAALTSLCACSQKDEPVPESKPPRVIMIVIDSLRYDHLNAYGFRRETAPNIAQFATESVTFDRAISPSNYTGLSVSAMFTGKHPSKFLDPHPSKFWIPPEEKTLAEAFKEAGFDTFLWSSNMHLKKRGFGQGFKKRAVHYLQTTASVSIEGMIRQIKDKYKPQGKPEFHYIHTMDVHFPYTPPHPFEWQFISTDRPYVGSISKNGVPLDDLGNRIESSLPYYAQTHNLGFDDIKHLKDLYDGSIRYTDHYLPELLETLNYDPESDMLIITADHGEQFYSHGWWGHGRLLLPQEIHVPLIVKHPDFPPHAVAGPASLIDLYPTLCDIYGLKKPADLDGKSVAAALYGEKSLRGFAYSESFDHHSPGAAIVGARYLYYFQADRSTMHPWRYWPFQQSLYNIATDPECKINLAESDPGRTKALHETLIKTNPRWAPYTWETIQHTPEAMTFGDNQFKPGTLRHVVHGNETVSLAQMAEEKVLLNVARPVFKAAATIAAPGRPYALSFDCEILSGHARFQLFEDGSKDPVWTYEITRASGIPKHIRARIDPHSESVTFRAKALRGGELRLSNLQLRRLRIPEITPRPAPSVHKPDPKEPEHIDELTPGEKEALEAVGYLQ